MTKRTTPEFLNGIPELLVLRLLASREMYGYQLVQAIKASTAGTLDFGEGCIYPLLHRLEKQRLLTSRREKVGGRQRVVYRVTSAGHRRLSDSTAKWREVVNAVTHVLQGSEHGIQPLAG